MAVGIGGYVVEVTGGGDIVVLGLVGDGDVAVDPGGIAPPTTPTPLPNPGVWVGTAPELATGGCAHSVGPTAGGAGTPPAAGRLELAVGVMLGPGTHDVVGGCRGEPVAVGTGAEETMLQVPAVWFQ